MFLHGYDMHGQNIPAEGFDYARQWIPGLNPVYDSQAKGTVKK
jgi:hypothetical protein